MNRVTIIGAGLAGSEAALQLAGRGVPVRLVEQKPLARTAAQQSDSYCELVCSNSFRGAALSNAVGLLKEELRRLGSFILRAADAERVPAGGALAVDRERFSARVTARLRCDPLIDCVSEVVTDLPSDRPLILATGPLTGDALARALAARLGQGSLAYYDAIAPIVCAESLDWDAVFFGSRWDKGESDAERAAYVNCPMTEAEYDAFVDALLDAARVEAHAFEDARYFEGCLPIEVMAERGRHTLAFGPMKPVGLLDPRTGRRPYAVVQLRKEDEAGTAYNLVGFQTRLRRADQERVLRLIPGLGRAEFLRFGAVHRNTFVDAPRLLDETLQLRDEPGVTLTGQLAGTEGYVEAIAGGWLAAHFVAERALGRAPSRPPAATALGGLLGHLGRATNDYQPSNITFAHLPPWDGRRLKKRERNEAIAARALDALEAWRTSLHASASAAHDSSLSGASASALPGAGSGRL